MENIVLDKSGTLKFGYFYELIVTNDEEFLKFETGPTDDYISSLRESPDWIETGESYVVAAYNDGEENDPVKYTKKYRCSLNPEHVTEWYSTGNTVRLSSGPLFSPLLELDGDGNVYVLVTEKLGGALQQSGLTGFRLAEVKINDENAKLSSPKYVPTKLFELHFLGEKCFRPLSVVGAPNECPWCHVGPLICPECGHSAIFCENCMENCGVAPKKHKGEGDLRLILAGWENWTPAIIEVDRWDGSDFVFGSNLRGMRSHVVTKRTVDWLLSVHATQFFARPVLANIEGIDPQKLAKLEAATNIQTLQPPTEDVSQSH